MNNKDERNFKVIESTEVKSPDKTVKDSSRQTNPIAKKFLEFHNEKAEKFGVKDLFRK